MHYRSMADLNDVIVRNLHRLPADPDLVVGVPRSGLLAAGMAALALNAPLADIDGFLDGRMLGAGRTRRRASFDQGPETWRRVLVMDDSQSTGTAMRQARERVEAVYPDMEVTYCAVYGTKAEAAPADLVLEVVPLPRLFQWNFMHHDLLEHACVDIDGVLCRDPTAEENDDGEAYVRFLLEAPALYTPTKPLGWLVTSRLEKYRAQTEAWLQRRGVAYRELVMLDLPDAESRRRANAHGAFKAEVYRRTGALLFIESEQRQAEEIARASGKPVLCVDTQALVTPEFWSAETAVQSIRTLPARLRLAHHDRLTKAEVGAKAFARRLLGEGLYGGIKRIARGA